MRIAIDATAIPPRRAGAGIYIFNLVQALAAVDKGNQYFVFSTSEHIEQWKIHQPNFRFLPMCLPATPVRLLWEQVGLPGALRRLRIDVLHSPHYTRPVYVPCRSVVTFCDMTYLLFPEMHGAGKGAFFRSMMRFSARRADSLIAISESTRQDMVRLLNVDPEKIVPIPLAASCEYRPLREAEYVETCMRHNVTPRGYILYVGVLEPRKNVPALVEAYAKVQSDFPDIPLVIAGKKGWMYEEIFRRVTALGLQERIRFLGYVPEQDLIPLYNGARAFIYPSRYEGFGLPILEAMQCGAPVVTSNISSMPEVAGDAALLVDPTDVDGFATALQCLLSDDAMRQDLTRKGLERASEFSWQRCAYETLNVYLMAGGAV